MIPGELEAAPRRRVEVSPTWRKLVSPGSAKSALLAALRVLRGHVFPFFGRAVFPWSSVLRKETNLKILNSSLGVGLHELPELFKPSTIQYTIHSLSGLIEMHCIALNSLIGLNDPPVLKRALIAHSSRWVPEGSGIISLRSRYLERSF